MANKRNGNSYLPRELVEDILLRLPVKALSRFKCVSKNWFSLIESKKFVRQHFESNQERLLIRLLKNQDEILNGPARDVDEHKEVLDEEMYGEQEEQDDIVDEDEEAEVPDEEMLLSGDGCRYGLSVDGMFSEYEEPLHLQIPYEALYVSGPLDGVFCVVTRYPWGPMALVNPALRQFKPLPLLQSIDPPPPLSSLTGDFKLVLLRYEDDYTCVVHVCTSDSDSWRVLDHDEGSINPRRCALASPCNTYMNGSYYWLLDNFADDDDELILAFDMGTEKFREIKVATGDYHLYISGLILSLCRDKLALLSYDHAAACIDIWLMETEVCWIKSSSVGPLVDIPRPFCLFKNTILFQTMTGFLAQCDVSTLESNTFSAKRMKNWSFSHWVYVYKESLVSIKGNAGKCRLWDPSSDLVKNFFKDSTSKQEPIAA